MCACVCVCVRMCVRVCVRMCVRVCMEGPHLEVVVAPPVGASVQTAASDTAEQRHQEHVSVRGLHLTPLPVKSLPVESLPVQYFRSVTSGIDFRSETRTGTGDVCHSAALRSTTLGLRQLTSASRWLRHALLDCVYACVTLNASQTLRHA